MEKQLKRSRFMYILEAGFEYLVAILVSTTFLATLTAELGMSDSLTGILSSIISLGCVFQLGSLFYKGRRLKPFVTLLSVCNQVLFLLLYVIPLFSWSRQVKITAFVIMIVLAYLLYNIAHPKKIYWLMSLVSDDSRGKFTANKEIISLGMGILFTFAMGAVVDHYKEAGQIRPAFVICACTIAGLTILHTLTLLFTVEKPATPKVAESGIFKGMLSVLRDKNVQRVAILFILWNIARYVAMPFYGSYQIKELGFSLTLVSVIATVASIVRILFSRALGSYADKKSFASMIQLCFIASAIGHLAMMFTVPSNGKLFFTIYSVFDAIALAGINSSLINLIFDYVTEDKRSDALAISTAFGGVAGFLTTLGGSYLVAYIQQNGDHFAGLPLYAQQVVSAIAFLFTLICILYVTLVMQRKNKS